MDGILMITETSKEKAKFLRTIYLDSRMKILDVLTHHGPLEVNRISELTHLEQSSVSHQLKILKNHKIVSSEIAGKKRIYTINPKVKDFNELINDHLEIVKG